MEAEYEKILRGKPGKKLYEVDSTERPVSDLRIDGPDPGNNLVLSLDVDLQKDVERSSWRAWASPCRAWRWSWPPRRGRCWPW